MSILLHLAVQPADGQVALLDATWQDYPEWADDTGPWVAYRAGSLINPHSPPFPGVAVATSSGTVVTVEVATQPPADELHQVHRTVLCVGSHGLRVGDEASAAGFLPLDLPRGNYPLEVWVDGVEPGDVTQVMFVIGSRHDVV